MNAFTREVRQLVDTVERLRAQHKAGVTPPYGALDDLFDQTAAVRASLDAVEHHALTPPAARVLEHVTPGRLRLSMDLSAVACAVLTALETAPRAAGE